MVLSRALGRVASWALARARPHSAATEGVDQWDLVRYLTAKGGLAVVRGTLRRPRLGAAGFPLFVGAKVKISFPERLSAGSAVSIGDFSRLNCYAAEGVRLGSRVTLREFGWLQLSSSVANPGQSITIGDDTYIGPYWVLGAAAPITIGERCQFGARVSLIAEMHEIPDRGEIFGSGVNRRGITIGDDVWIGDGVSVLDGVTVGSGSVIGAGSVVTTSIAPGSVAAGIPCRVLRSIDSRDQP